MCWCQQTSQFCDECENLHRIAWLCNFSSNKLHIPAGSRYFTGEQLDYSDEEDVKPYKPVKQLKLVGNTHAQAKNRYAVLATLGENDTNVKSVKTTNPKQKK